MNKTDQVVKQFLTEANIEVSRNIVSKAIKEGKPILVSSSKTETNKSLITDIVVIPTEIKGDLVIGVTEHGKKPFEANLTDVVSQIGESTELTEEVSHPVEITPEIQKLYDESFWFGADWKDPEGLIDSFTEAAANFGIERINISDFTLFIGNVETPETKIKLKRLRLLRVETIDKLVLGPYMLFDLINDHIDSIAENIQESVPKYWNLGVTEDLGTQGSDQYGFWLSPRPITEEEQEGFNTLERKARGMEDETEEIDEALTISLSNSKNVDVNKLDDLAKKTDVVLTEEEAVEGDSQRDLAIFNLKNWVSEIGLNLGHSSEVGNLISYTIDASGKEEKFKKQPIVYIYPSGHMTISGHKITSFTDFQNVINFLKDLNE